ALGGRPASGVSSDGSVTTSVACDPALLTCRLQPGASVVRPRALPAGGSTTTTTVGQRLARTGAPTDDLAGIGAALVLVGAVLQRGRRRPKHAR
ncbi:MAG: hypothetical protein JWN17_246, partial [Frankiales bacterium]|nr:hypothetical protein [Frankiales bacterium]